MITFNFGLPMLTYRMVRHYILSRVLIVHYIFKTYYIWGANKHLLNSSIRTSLSVFYGNYEYLVHKMFYPRHWDRYRGIRLDWTNFLLSDLIRMMARIQSGMFRVCISECIPSYIISICFSYCRVIYSNLFSSDKILYLYLSL